MNDHLYPDFPFDTVLVANRGIIARRVLRTCQELGLRGVGVYAPEDLRLNLLSQAAAVLPIPNLPTQTAYLNAAALVELAQTQAQGHPVAVHPGYGFLSENPTFARACQAAGLIWIGPSPAVLELSGDKVRCAEIMRKAGLPVLPSRSCSAWSPGLQAELEALGLPLLLKPAWGGGGIGMRQVEHPEDLRPALEQSLELAQRHFAEGTVLAERWLSMARHIEVQVLADVHGDVQTLFERECSLQRRRQKVIEEGPAPNLSDHQRQTLHELALAAARAVGLDQVATVEFLWDGQDFWFLEINPRLQVEHGVTEMISGLDLVEMQLRLAAGAPLKALNLPTTPQGHAFEARLYAEEPWTGLPAPGQVQHLRLPDGHGLRIERGVYAGMSVSADFDPLLLKVMAQGPERERARRRLYAALEALEIEGDEAFASNQAALLQALNLPELIEGHYHTRSLEVLEAPACPAEIAVLQPLLADLDTLRRQPKTSPSTYSGQWRPAHWS